MPRPLPAPDTPDSAFYAALAERPLDAAAHQYLADWEEERGPKGELRRNIEALRARLAPLHLPLPALAHLELLRGATLIEEEYEQIRMWVRELLEMPADLLQNVDVRPLERRISAALGQPQRGLDALDPLDPGNLRLQYGLQKTLLASLDLLETRGQELVITGVDRHPHPLPPLAEIERRLRSPALREKVRQGFDQLLLVPVGAPLTRLLACWGRALRRNAHILAPYGHIDRQLPVASHDLRNRGSLAYFPRRFAGDHGGSATKGRLLADDPAAAWQVLLTEGGLFDLPPPGQGRMIGGRRQIGAGRRLVEYLADLPACEVGLTPEAYIMAFLTTLERTGRPLDFRTCSYLTACYLPAFDCVPAGRCVRTDGRLRAEFDMYFPESEHANIGVRTAVRIL